MAIQGPHSHLAKIFWTSERGPLLDRAHTLHFATLFILTCAKPPFLLVLLLPAQAHECLNSSLNKTFTERLCKIRFLT